MICNGTKNNEAKEVYSLCLGWATVATQRNATDNNITEHKPPALTSLLCFSFLTSLSFFSIPVSSFFPFLFIYLFIYLFPQREQLVQKMLKRDRTVSILQQFEATLYNSDHSWNQTLSTNSAQLVYHP